MPAKKNILIADDSVVNRRILSKILKNDYNLIEAENGEIALSILHENYNSISVILLDIVMPILDGYEVLRQMREDEFLSKIPVIVASGQSTEDAEVKALSLGANDYVLKPYKPEIIRHRIANTIYLKETSALINSVQHDSLTKVYGKDYFYLQVAQILRNNPNTKYDLICLDIERFKLVNDIYGMQVGDTLLQYVGSIVLKQTERIGVCGRIGADEFACLISHREDYQKKYFTEVIDLVNAFSSDIKLDLNLRYGIYFIEDTTIPVNIMCDRAILAKESIKGKYDTYFAYYDDNIRQKLLNEQMIISDMKRAIEEDQFQVFFQPKYVLKTEKIMGAEALVRWFHPKKGTMYPGEFIPLFEKNGFITDLDIYIWDKCCQKIRSWIDKGHSAVPISINVSRADIYNPNLPQIILSMIQKYELSPRYLHLEITESAYTENPEQLIEIVSKLKKLGFIIEMDDFGTGYSSLNMLSELPIDILKLDMRFIQKEERKHQDQSILSFIISLAKWMNLKVVAEGIETQSQVHLLKSLNCEFAQGYYYAKPMPQKEFEKHLLKSEVQINTDGELEKITSEEVLQNQKKVMIVLDSENKDFPILEKEYERQFQMKHFNTIKEVDSFFQNSNKIIGVFVIVFSPNITSKKIEKLLSFSSEINIPVMVLYEKEDLKAEELLALNICDYECKPYDFRQLSLRLENAMAYAKMEKFEQEKEINAALIEMRKRAEHDVLTGLLNRAEYEVKIDQFFYKNAEPQGIFIMLDVDNFKNVNDTYGHIVGDRVLNAVGKRLQSIFTETQIIGRIGGDEFSLFIPFNIPLIQLKNKMNQLCTSFLLDIEDISISCSAGVCYSPEYGINHKDLYKNADVALIAAKRKGKRQFEIFSSGMKIPSAAAFDMKTIQLLDNVSDAMFVSDSITSEIIYINDTAVSILGRNKEDCLGKRCYQLFWDRCRNCDRCTSIGTHEQDFYEETTFLKDKKTPVHIKARLEDWDGRKVKVHYLQLRSNFY